MRTMLCLVVSVWLSAAQAADAVQADSLQRIAVRYPLWVSRPDGSWHATLKSLTVNAHVEENLFTPALADDQ
jgi:opacity protein-like surface antigen